MIESPDFPTGLPTRNYAPDPEPLSDKPLSDGTFTEHFLSVLREAIARNW
jgi:hypothetical protein